MYTNGNILIHIFQEKTIVWCTICHTFNHEGELCEVTQLIKCVHHWSQYTCHFWTTWSGGDGRLTMTFHILTKAVPKRLNVSSENNRRLHRCTIASHSCSISAHVMYGIIRATKDDKPQLNTMQIRTAVHRGKLLLFRSRSAFSDCITRWRRRRLCALINGVTHVVRWYQDIIHLLVSSISQDFTGSDAAPFKDVAPPCHFKNATPTYIKFYVNTILIWPGMLRSIEVACWKWWKR